MPDYFNKLFLLFSLPCLQHVKNTRGVCHFVHSRSHRSVRLISFSKNSFVGGEREGGGAGGKKLDIHTHTTSMYAFYFPMQVIPKMLIQDKMVPP